MSKSIAQINLLPESQNWESQNWDNVPERNIYECKDQEIHTSFLLEMLFMIKDFLFSAPSIC